MKSVVVCQLMSDGQSVRGQRARRIAEQLTLHGDVQLIPPAAPPKVSGARTFADRALAKLTRLVSLDDFELRSRASVRPMRDAELAILVGWPFSGVYYGARRCVELGIPYVVDVGDPWALTANEPSQPMLANLRALRAEDFVWRHASGAILTTDLQKSRLQEHFPSLPVLVRPNGVEQVATPLTPSAQRGHDDVLKLAHFGSVYGARLNLATFVRHLSESGLWREVQLDVYGAVDDGTVQTLTSTSGTVFRALPTLPWQEVVSLAQSYDAAVALGNHDPAQLPSKAITYGSLSLPLLAFVGEGECALSQYVRSRPGWLLVQPRTSARQVAEFLMDPGELDSLDPQDTWPLVVKRVVSFAVSVCRPPGVGD